MASEAGVDVTTRPAAAAIPAATQSTKKAVAATISATSRTQQQRQTADPLCDHPSHPLCLLPDPETVRLTNNILLLFVADVVPANCTAELLACNVPPFAASTESSKGGRRNAFAEARKIDAYADGANVPAVGSDGRLPPASAKSSSSTTSSEGKKVIQRTSPGTSSSLRKWEIRNSSCRKRSCRLWDFCTKGYLLHQSSRLDFRCRVIATRSHCCSTNSGTTKGNVREVRCVPDAARLPQWPALR